MDLNFNLTQLNTLFHDLVTVKDNFEQAEKFSDAVSAAVGHAGLSDRVQDFADQWNDKRDGMVERLADLAKTVDTIHDSFISVDLELRNTAHSKDDNYSGNL
ncbi:hypothetical protein E3T55_00095 [Cryobacterium frigoriphilum]|uniref:WXG100 family type VII secretion target n=1 Tax=Cryobacterium frigoriphilum TaxID=1259150 RepID=A0A4R9ABY6_9MICO|nr:hypothetical protein [Cryobacterium frigoriphilum]TFD56084.1 hypothetical protein E3T55_00095 [Cryobacterium frigoriphilum]